MTGTTGYDANSAGGNNDTFVNVCFEGSSVETAVRVTGSYATFVGGSYESLPAGRIKIESTAKGTTFFGGYQMYGRSSALIVDNGINTVVHGEFGSTAYGDSARAGGGLNGAVGAYCAYVSSSSSDLLWTGHNAARVMSSRLDGAGRLSLGAAAFPSARIDPASTNPFGGGTGAVVFGRGTAEPDAALGRSVENQPAVVSNVAVLSKTQYVAATTASTTVNCYLADVHVVTLSAATTLALALPAKPTGWSQIIHLEIVQDSTGGRAVTLPSDVAWASGAPTLTTTAGRRDIFVLRYDVAAARWYEVSRSLNVG